MLVYETKPIKLSRMLSMSHITQSGSLYQEFCFPSLQSALPFSSFTEITDTKRRSINTRAS